MFEHVERANERSLFLAGGYIRRTAMNASGRVRKASAAAGMSWLSKRGRPLAKAMTFIVNKQKTEVMIGPASGGRGGKTSQAPRALEYGGLTVMMGRSTNASEFERRRKIQQANRNRNRYARRTRRRTKGEIQNIKHWFGEHDWQKPLHKTVNMAPRPTLHIALYKSVPKIKEVWKYIFSQPHFAPERFYGVNGVDIRAIRKIWGR